MDTVLGVSMAPTAVRMVLVEGENGDGATVDEDNFAIAADDDAITPQFQRQHRFRRTAFVQRQRHAVVMRPHVECILVGKRNIDRRPRPHRHQDAVVAPRNPPLSPRMSHTSCRR